MGLDWSQLLVSQQVSVYPTTQEIRSEVYTLVCHLSVHHGPGVVDPKSCELQEEGLSFRFPPQPEWLEALAAYSLRTGGHLGIVRFASEEPAAYSALCAGWRGDMLAVEMFLYSVEER